MSSKNATLPGRGSTSQGLTLRTLQPCKYPKYSGSVMSTALPKHVLKTIGRLNEEQLDVLHTVVVKRLRQIDRAKDQKAMRNFQIFDRVAFNHRGVEKTGTVTRLNQKTVSVRLDDKSRWNVSPHFLTKIDSS